MKKQFAILAAGVTLLAVPALSKPAVAPKPAPNKVAANEKQTTPKIQVALLLDTSNSMDGLIAQAKQQLWKIVNELSKADADGRPPKLEVALYEYGNDSLPVTGDYIRQVTPFTGDLDRISEELFKLKTNGGSEYCGAVIKHSIDHLEWSKSSKDLKAIFIAGNEPFNQGTSPYQESCSQAKTKGIVVNTIFCGNRAEGEKTFWNDGANIAQGRFLIIDQDRAVADIATPYDKEIAELGQKINSTYVSYGAKGNVGYARQSAQDQAAGGISTGNMAARAQSKASANYSNEEWDLVDAKKEKKVEIAKIPEASLPAPMRGMSTEEKEKYVESKQKERVSIQARINELSKKREAYIAQNQKKDSDKESLDEAMLKTIRQQATDRGLHFKSK